MSHQHFPHSPEGRDKPESSGPRAHDMTHDTNHSGDRPQGNDPLGSLDSLGSSLGSLDEQALRRLLHGAVEDLEPSPDALEHLRRAVPARRTRRRQAVVGAAAAVILGATALPALIHVATTAGTADDHAANAASSRQRTHELTGGQRGADGDEVEPEHSHGSTRPEERKKDEEKKREEERKKDGGSATGPTGSIAGTAPAPGPTLIAASPTCDRDQLGKGTSTVGAADKNGKIYGTFRVVNVSGTVCSVAGSGVVTAHAQGSADSTRVTVVDHTSGDAAPALPDPSVQPSQVILQPGQAYEIKFAWVPAADGGPSGCARPTAPTATPQTTAATAAPSATKTEEKVQPQDPDQPKPPATVVLSHTPDVGEPKAADATLPDACAGTIYRTGPLAAQTPPSA